jgi:hypothetical protein
MLDTLVNQMFKDYVATLTSKYNYDASVLQLEWKSTWANFSIVKAKVEVKVPPPALGAAGVLTCPYKTTRGVNMDSVCNAKVKEGHVVCTKHIKYEARYKSSGSSTVKVIKQHTKIKTTNTDELDTDIINTCAATTSDEAECVNIDGLQVHEINQLYKKLFNDDGVDYFKKRNASIQEVFFEKRRIIVNELIKTNKPVKATLKNWKKLSHHELTTLKTRRGGTVVNLTKFKQSSLWVDIITGLFFKSPTELVVVGRINQLYDQPLLCIDGYAFDLILKHDFDYDPSLLNDEGRQAESSFKKQLLSSQSQTSSILDSNLEEANDDDVII